MSDAQRDAPAVALTPEIVAYLERAGVEVAAGAGDVLVRRGEPGRAFWVVLAGMVEVRLTGEDGVSLPLARLGAGATFGEMALVTGDPVSADVVALTPVRLLRYPAERFACALGRVRAAARAGHGAHGREPARHEHRRLELLPAGARPQRAHGPARRERAARRGERGDAAGARGHRAPRARHGAGARQRRRGDGEALRRGQDPRRGGAARGRRSSPWTAARSTPRTRCAFSSARRARCRRRARTPGALRRYGALQLAHGGTLVLRHAETLPPAAREAVGGYAATRRQGCPSTRRPGSSRPPRSRRRRSRRRAPELAAAFADDALVLPRLQERRRDILPLARIFLAEAAARREPKRLGGSAEHALLSQRYAHRNVAELHEAIGMAVADLGRAGDRRRAHLHRPEGGGDGPGDRPDAFRRGAAPHLPRRCSGRCAPRSSRRSRRSPWRASRSPTPRPAPPRTR